MDNPLHIPQNATIQTVPSADVVFVLDCTGSMKAEIGTIKKAIHDFADALQEQGILIHVGLVGFRDRFEAEEPEVVRLTANITAFQNALADLEAAGGGDIPESSLDALMTALNLNFSTSHQKVLVLITDAPPHIPDKQTQSLDEVMARMEQVGIRQFYPVFPTANTDCHIYLDLLQNDNWNSQVFDLGKGDSFEAQAAHFKQTLLNLAGTIALTTLHHSSPR